LQNAPFITFIHFKFELTFLEDLKCNLCTNVRIVRTVFAW
jgi:hypothetical protein